MLQKSIPTEIVQSDCSYDDERIFEQVWLPKACNWITAEVDRYRGLTLIYEENGHAHGVHFTCSLCGYYGSGTMATAKILSQAGFGDKEVLLSKVSDTSKTYLVFSK